MLEFRFKEIFKIYLDLNLNNKNIQIVDDKDSNFLNMVHDYKLNKKN